MSRILLKSITAVATIIAVVILIACIVTIAITNRNQNVALENENSTKENNSSKVKIRNSTIRSQYNSVGTNDSQTEKTGNDKVLDVKILMI